ncbi:MAG TPA: antibiotic biosynthesis monooxygenase [Candidatus Luteococcus avicola]|nr:antibiotic biosynthesis monooxygenase [Candidatus Luteococcus avicola]
MLVINRFRSETPDATGVLIGVGALADVYRAAAGNESVELVQNLDEPELVALVTRWTNVGSYRRALFGFAAQQAFVGLLAWMVDEPSAYLDPTDVGENIPRSNN